jgi:hypothetical protein
MRRTRRSRSRSMLPRQARSTVKAVRAFLQKALRSGKKLVRKISCRR